jgi:hypothetical protein
MPNRKSKTSIYIKKMKEMSTSLIFGGEASWYKGLATGFASSTDSGTDQITNKLTESIISQKINK